MVPAHLGLAAGAGRRFPDVRADLEDFFRQLVPDSGGVRYRHEDEGPDDMPAHIRAALI
jgi:thiamine phosphate synthase YjbQ (UPF0047 family)